MGRHGPGNNIFAYFVEPNGFVLEYTTRMEQIEESTYQPQSADYWSAFQMRPCRWGMAMTPSKRVIDAFAGQGTGQQLDDRPDDETGGRVRTRKGGNFG